MRSVRRPITNCGKFVAVKFMKTCNSGIPIKYSIIFMWYFIVGLGQERAVMVWHESE